MSDVASNRPRAVVAGAGVVGTCTALYLQKEGFQVTLIDPEGPGTGCSSGNSGNLGIASCVPTGTPGIYKKLPRMLLNPGHPLIVRARNLPQTLPWFARFLAASQHERVVATADALISLMSRLFDAYDPLLKEANAQHFVSRVGRLFVYDTADGFKNDKYTMDLRRERGVEIRDLSGDEVREIAPAVGPVVKAGCFIPNGGHSLDPQGMVEALARLFVQKGGTLLRNRVVGCEPNGDGGARIACDGQAIEAEKFIVAAGARSGPLAAQLGARIPLVAERGYHVMIKDPGVSLPLPVQWGGRYMVLTPMAPGLRISGITEFAGFNAPLDPKLCDIIMADARELVPSLRLDVSSRWAGERPSTPDSLPVIGHAPNRPWALFAFGHGHVGLGTGAITGRIVAQLAAGREPEVDINPFRPDRF
jgi:D-amino-acid dehydrogenase